MAAMPVGDAFGGFLGLFHPVTMGIGERRHAASRLVPVGATRRFLEAGPVALATGRGCAARAGNALLALDGRIDNADDLRAVLGPAIAGDDASLVIACLRRWGEEAPAHLRGEFAFAFWDGDSGNLTLASDPLGQRSVLYARCDGVLAFAAALRTLLAVPGVPRDLDESYVAAFLSDVVPDPDATPYAAIRRVPAACTISVGRDGTMRVREYWRPAWGRRIDHPRNEDYVGEARDLLDRAVRRKTRDLATVVCQLSGGLDSSGVAATAARQRAPATVHALTVAPPDGVPRFGATSAITDERALAGAVARMHPNMAWEALSSASLHPLDENPARLFLTLGMPARNVMNIGWLAPLFDRARGMGAGVVLSGSLGNMTLSWTGLPGLADMARRGQWRRLWREASALGRAHGLHASVVLRRHALRPLLPARMQSWLDERRGLPGPDARRYCAIHPDFARATRIEERRLDMGHDFDGDSETMRRRWLSRVQRLPPVMGALGDALGVEIRDPTADLDLLEFCFAVPDEQYLRDGTTRWLARRVLADRLPPEVVNETRRGYQCAEFLHRMALQRDTIVEQVEALGRSPLASRVLDVERMRRLAAEWPTDAAATPFGEYGAVLNRGLHVGRFLRWIEGGNA